MDGFNVRIACFITCLVTYALAGTFEVKTSLTGYYSITVDGSQWLSYADRFFYISNKRYRVSVWEDSLHLEKTTYTTGMDKLGSWKSVNYWYYAGDVPLLLYIKTYTQTDRPFAIFSQKYLVAVNGTKAPPDIKTISGFPTFDLFMSPRDLGYISYGGKWIGDENKRTGLWNIETAEIQDGYDGGPVCVFDKKGNAIVISAFNQFMSASIHYHTEAGGARAYWGIMGDVDSVPAGFEYQTILYYSSDGINKAFDGWGQTLRKWYNKLEKPTQDPTLSYTGYWMNYGSFYYKNPLANRTYQDTILEVQKTVKQLNSSVNYFQIDDWWYQKENNRTTVVTWDADVTAIPNGMTKFQKALGAKFAAQCGIWSANTTYAKINGGNFSFLVDGDAALPNQSEFWDYLFSTAEGWGLSVFEQDWMSEQSKSMSVLQTDLNIAKQWLVDMGIARKYNISIQYSGALPRHALQSLEVHAVTQVRVSGNYMKDPDQWKIGISSILANALGLAPFKDTFWTNETELGNSLYSREPAPLREEIVATLSTGTVAFGDKLSSIKHTTNCCNENGLILKPSRPARAIDAQIIQAAFQDGSGPDGEVWTTYSEIGGYKFGIIFASNLTGTFFLNQTAAFGRDFPLSKQFDMGAPQFQYEFSDKKPIKLCCTDKWPFYLLFFTSPVIYYRNVEVLLIGEYFKWVPMSPQRVINISLSDSLTVTFTGKPGEKITFIYSVNSLAHFDPVIIGTGGITVHVLNTTAPPTTTTSPVTRLTTEGAANQVAASLSTIMLIVFSFTKCL